MDKRGEFEQAHGATGMAVLRLLESMDVDTLKLVGLAFPGVWEKTAQCEASIRIYEATQTLEARGDSTAWWIVPGEAAAPAEKGRHTASGKRWAKVVTGLKAEGQHKNGYLFEGGWLKDWGSLDGLADHDLVVVSKPIDVGRGMSRGYWLLVARSGSSVEVGGDVWTNADLVATSDGPVIGEDGLPDKLKYLGGTRLAGIAAEIDRLL